MPGEGARPGEGDSREGRTTGSDFVRSFSSFMRGLFSAFFLSSVTTGEYCFRSAGVRMWPCPRWLP